MLMTDFSEGHKRTSAAELADLDWIEVEAV
jgi:hypothetical protein